MLKRKFSVILLSACFLTACISDAQQNKTDGLENFVSIVQTGELLNDSINTDKLFVNKKDKADWNYSVYIPPNFTKEKEYPVIYMLHGAGGDFTNWPTKAYIAQKLDRLIATGDLPPSIVVFPDGFTSYYIDGDKHRMQTAFIEELMPTIANKYPVIKDRNAHAIGGLSMGGFGSSRFALLYPEKFSSVVMLSPALWSVDSMPESRKENFAKDRADVYGNPFDNERLRKHQYDNIILKDNKKWPLSFYVAFGSADTVTSPADAKGFIQWAQNNQFEVESHQYNGYGHSWDFWNASVDDGLRFIGKKFRQHGY